MTAFFYKRGIREEKERKKVMQKENVLRMALALNVEMESQPYQMCARDGVCAGCGDQTVIKLIWSFDDVRID
ncbi:hypothetical protein BpHYR1_002262 [Brachionus plicatilis]|uniref:Uncharacterized protein n=1 Tax=Brachionus plicatilis TaxID=10195 RepID=A0A3M7SMI7_BRAPC|nr:hypothetical protein BpHYR1_002262 [Brachionus plicatilis]